MANQTLFGIVELGEGTNRKRLSNATFRLHLGRGVSKSGLHLTPPNSQGFVVVPMLGGSHAQLTIHIGDGPSAGLIYERELHLSDERHHWGHRVLHLKEGARFLETIADDTFPTWLGEFLAEKIPELNQPPDC